MISSLSGFRPSSMNRLASRFCLASSRGVVSAPSTRKGKKSKSQDEDSGNMTATKFTSLLDKSMTAIHVALESIAAKNTHYKLKFDTKAPQLELDCSSDGRGSYVLRGDYDNQLLILQSPVSGTMQYFYDNTASSTSTGSGEKEEQKVDMSLWLNVHDGHDIRGIITRDLLRHARGVVDFK